MAMRKMALALFRSSPRAGAALRDPTGETAPRHHLLEDEFAVTYDQSMLAGVPTRWRALYRALPQWLRMGLEIHRRRGEYDVIVTWGDRVSLALMALQSLSRRRKPHLAMLSWVSKPNVGLPLRIFGRSLLGIVTWSSTQRTYAAERIGVPASKVYLVKYPVDQRFWSPRPRETDMICSVGQEMRDYPTLLEALRGTSLRCHIATDHVRVYRSGLRHRRLDLQEIGRAAGDNVTMGALPLPELRELYARSRFVVVPLLPTRSDNGVTVILEAMAMGKPVICSRTRGQVDVVQDGVTGIFVPIGDPAALRAAMLALWNDPARARAMGDRARAYVAEHHSLDKFCQDVRQSIDAALAGRGAAADGSLPAPGALVSGGDTPCS